MEIAVTDIDSYFLKCSLDSLDEGMPAHAAQAKCEHEMQPAMPVKSAVRSEEEQPEVVGEKLLEGCE